MCSTESELNADIVLELKVESVGSTTNVTVFDDNDDDDDDDNVVDDVALVFTSISFRGT